MIGLTEALAEFIHTKTLDDVPSDALGKVKKAIAKTLAVILAGSEMAPTLLRFWSFTDKAASRPQIADILRRINVGEDARRGHCKVRALHPWTGHAAAMTKPIP